MPRWHIRLQLTNDWKLISGRRLFLRRPQLQRQQRPEQSPIARIVPAPRCKLAFSRDRFQVALVGKNLTNEVANLGDNRSIAAEVPGRPRLFVNQPRTLGVEFRQSF